MVLSNFSTSWISIIPPILTIVIAILTRRTILSLSIGSIVGALFLVNFSIYNFAIYLFDTFISIFWSWEQNQLNSDRAYLILFMLLLGVLYSLISFTGGAKAFSQWIQKKINTPVKAQLSTILLSFMLFIDDYFNVLVAGKTCRIITDKQKISRAKLAYLVHSTSSPICSIMPFSSCGAYMISLISMVIVTRNITDYNPFSTFLKIIPYHLYAIFAIAVMVAVVILKLDFFGMAKHEKLALQGKLFDYSKGNPPGISNNEFSLQLDGKPWMLIVPIIVLAIVTIAMMVLTGHYATPPKDTFSIITALEYTQPGLSLLIGVIAGIFILLISLLFNKNATKKSFIQVIISGLKSMKIAIIILITAWFSVSVIEHLGSGKFLALSLSSSVNVIWLPVIVFFISCLISFATGSSWGTFGIMVPLIADFVFNSNTSINTDIFIPLIAALMSGSIFGDHCSPVSDTTVLSSVGSSCHHIDHVITQLPYSLLAAFISFIGFLVMGIFNSTFIGFFAAIFTFVLIISFMYLIKKLNLFQTNTV